MLQLFCRMSTGLIVGTYYRYNTGYNMVPGIFDISLYFDFSFICENTPLKYIATFHLFKVLVIECQRHWMDAIDNLNLNHLSTSSLT